MMTTFDKNCLLVKAKFDGCTTKELIYKKMMELGSGLAPLDPKFKTDEHLVSGCQSALYIRSYSQNQKVYFEADADALISKGISYLLTSTYNGLSPEEILTTPPNYLFEMGIYASLSLNRSNGLSSLLLRMKQEAMKYL